MIHRSRRARPSRSRSLVGSSSRKTSKRASRRAARPARAASPPDSDDVGCSSSRSVRPSSAQTWPTRDVEVGRTERQPVVEGDGVAIAGAVDVGGQRHRRRFQLGRRGRHARSPRQVHGDGLDVGPCGLLRQVADRRRRRSSLDGSTLERHRAGERLQQRRLADAVGTDDTDPLARRDDEVDRIEHGGRAAHDREAAGTERGGAGHDQRPRSDSRQDAAGPVVREVVPRPVDEHVDPVAEPHQVDEVQPEPRHPPDRAAQAPAVGQLGDGVVASDRGHLALVAVAERLGGTALDATHDLAGDVAAALHRRRRDLRERRAVTIRRGGDVADREHLRPPGDRQIRLDDEPAAARGRRAEHRRQRVGGHARGPHRRARRDHRPVGQAHPGLVDRGDADAEPDLDASPLERPPGPRRRLRRERVSGGGRPSRRARSGRRARGGAGSPSPARASTARASAPAISTPVGPPPHTTTSRAPSATAPSDAARSKRSSTWARSRRASSRCLSGKPCSTTPGTSKWCVTAPAATTSSVVGQDAAVVEADLACVEVDARHAGHPHVDVAGPAASGADDPADGVGHVLGVQAGRGDLVQQRLEGVEVVGVDQRHLDRLTEQATGRGEAAEAGADDDDAGAVGGRRHTPTVGSAPWPS